MTTYKPNLNHVIQLVR